MALWSTFASIIMFLFLLCCLTTVRAQGGPVSNCWFDAPELLDTSIQVDTFAQNRTGSDGSRTLDLVTRVTWQRPAVGMQRGDMYSIRLTKFDGMMMGESVVTDPCLVQVDEIMVEEEEYVFHNLSFGQLYELEIHIYRPVVQQKSIPGAMTAFETPDCFLATGDMGFCLDQVTVQYSGSPVDPMVESLCRNSSTSLLRVSLSWLPPFQVHGDILVYSVDYGVVMTPAPPDAAAQGTPNFTLLTLNVAPSLSKMSANDTNVNQTVSRVTANLEGLNEGKLYYVRITPIVISPSDGAMNPGDDVELTFMTANWTDPMGETTEINLATPLCEDVNRTPTEPTSSNTTQDNTTKDIMTTEYPTSSITGETTSTSSSTSPTATTPMRLPPSQMDPAHIALIVIFTLLIVAVIIAFIVVTIRMARSGQVAKLPQLSQLPTMCKRHKDATVDEQGKKKKDLNAVEKGVKAPAIGKKSKQTSCPAKGKNATKK